MLLFLLHQPSRWVCLDLAPAGTVEAAKRGFLLCKCNSLGILNPPKNEAKEVATITLKLLFA